MTAYPLGGKVQVTMSAHKPCYIMAVVVAIICFLVTITFNALAGASTSPFLNSTGDISDKYYLEITPAGWTFSIWGVIYFWQVVWLLYGVSTLFRKGVDGDYLYASSDIMPVWIYVVYSVNLVLNLSWLLLWDRELLIISCVFSALMAFTLYVCLFFSFRAVYRHLGVLGEAGLMKEAWMIRWMVQNGLAFYATWVTIATLLNLGSVIAYWGAVAQDIASSVCLAILSLEIALWFGVENFVLDKYVRYTFSPYVVVIWALAGSLSGNYTPGNRNSIWTITLLVVATASLLGKLDLMIWRHFKRPIATMIVSR